MSLYYEEFPAEDGDAPQLPPLLRLASGCLR